MKDAFKRVAFSTTPFLLESHPSNSTNSTLNTFSPSKPTSKMTRLPTKHSLLSHSFWTKRTTSTTTTETISTSLPSKPNTSFPSYSPSASSDTQSPPPSSTTQDASLTALKTTLTTYLNSLPPPQTNQDPLLTTSLRTPTTTNSFLRRFLNARQNNIPCSQQLLLSLLRWRAVTKPWTISMDYILHPKASWHLKYTGVKDKEGRPLMYARADKLDRRIVDKDVFHKACIAMCEFVLKLTTTPPSPSQPTATTTEEDGDEYNQFSVIYDCQNFSIFYNLPLQVLQKMFVVLQEYYPELLGKVWLINYSKTVHVAYKSISPFLDEYTKSKIVFVEDSGMQVLKEEIDDESLPKWLGGNSNFQFD